MIVVDTSVVVKWAVDEADADAARQLIGDELIAPDLLVIELGHVLTKKVRTRELDAGSARIAYGQLPLLVRLVSSRPLEQRAFDLSLLLHHGIADCYFLALAEIAAAELITADRRFASNVESSLATVPVRSLAQLV